MKVRNKYLIGFVFLLILMSITLINNSYSKKEEPEEFYNDKRVVIHYIDVGQADSIFIEFPNNESMLIDAGEKDSGQTIINYVENLGYKSLTYVVATHPHVDHIGGLETVIKHFEIENLYMPKAVATTKTYENLLKTIKVKDMKVKTAKRGVNIINEDNLDVSMLAPILDEYDNLNNYSAVIKLTYFNRTFLFMGDAEAVVEKELLNEVKADVIKVGHHGSKTSSSAAFVKAVNPTYAIISVGKDNDYGHPVPEIVERWEKVGAKIYRTDISGTIKIISDGDKIEIYTD